jgi:two-component system response regulator FixJ
MARDVICIIEPDETARNGLVGLLADTGAEIRTFASAEDLLMCIDRLQPLCLITESDLPGISGMELFEALCAAGHRIPTILMTMRGEVASAVSAIRAGVVDYLEKPYLHHSLHRRVTSIVRASGKRRPAQSP